MGPSDGQQEVRGSLKIIRKTWQVLGWHRAKAQGFPETLHGVREPKQRARQRSSLPLNVQGGVWAPKPWLKASG